MLRTVLPTRPEVHSRRLERRITPQALLSTFTPAERPVLVSFAGHVVVAANPVETVVGPDVWDALRIHCTPRSLGPSAILDGWIGLLGYDLAGTVETLPPPHPDPGGPPVGVLSRYRTAAVFDPYGSCELSSLDRAGDVDDLEGRARSVDESPSEPDGAPQVATSLPPDAYREAVEAARTLIQAGDCYQVNLTQRLVAPWTAGPVPLAAGLWAAAGRTSHQAYLGLPDGAVVSASPELLVRVCDGIATSEPIKGTAPLGQWVALATSPKDRAEHVMIVDLVRNDLGRVARAGGVSVPRLFEYLSTPYVEHMVSEVRAELRPDVTARDVLRAVFPGGSVTGTPKVRAMEVIRELEPVSRGPAFGSVVAVGTDGAIEASVAIRTAWVTPSEVRYWCGGAVVWDSDPAGEHAEAWAKAVPFLTAIGAS